MSAAPDFDRVDAALEEALAALPLAAGAQADAELRREYAALALYVLHTKERLALLHGAWAAQGLPIAEPEPLPTPLASPDASASRAARARKRRPGTA
jgi:hypothetical protein